MTFVPYTELRRFTRDNFVVILDYRNDPEGCDWSEDNDGDVLERVAAGELQCLEYRVRVLFRGVEVAADYLGNSVYAEPKDFAKEHIGAQGRWGSYFRDMIRRACVDARDFLKFMPYVRG